MISSFGSNLAAMEERKVTRLTLVGALHEYLQPSICLSRDAPSFQSGFMRKSPFYRNFTWNSMVQIYENYAFDVIRP